jgi:hypothetical protein
MVAMAKAKSLRWSATLEVAAHGILMPIFKQTKYHRDENHVAKGNSGIQGTSKKGPDTQ